MNRKITVRYVTPGRWEERETSIEGENAAYRVSKSEYSAHIALFQGRRTILIPLDHVVYLEYAEIPEQDTK